MDRVTDAVQIRPARPDEYDLVGKLTVDVYLGEGFVPPGDPYLHQLADVASRAPSTDILVAGLGDRVVGSLTITHPGTRYAEIARPGELEFRMLAVSKDARGTGAGTALVRTVLDRARHDAYEAVVLTTMPAMTDARRIYDRFGFVPVPERNWTPEGFPDADAPLLHVLRHEF